MNGREEMLEGTKTQKWNKEPRSETAAASRKQEGIEQDLQAHFCTEDHEVNSLISCEDIDNEC
jgi:hypothetical protein